MTAEAGYHTRPRPEMLAFVPAGARRVLDVGCGGGTFAARLRDERGAEVWGIEISPEAAALAAGRLDRVLVGDAVERLGAVPDGHFDCIVMNDILEHLVEPERLLRAAARKLAAGGCVVASIPSIRHFPHLVDLVLRGEWRYTDEGLLDRTHLRFFTRRSMLEMFAACGYDVRSIAGIHPTRSWRFRLFNLLTLGRLAETRYLQFAVVAAVARDAAGAPA
jgi:2-polyprenyl-3-methyl-5-hydroxy-6-metoxy-1,4-benzoquinol methylase